MMMQHIEGKKRVLIVFHGQLPGAHSPAPGIALRAWTLGEGLRRHGVEVCYTSRRQDQRHPPEPGQPPVYPFEGPAELQAIAERLAPSLILAVGADSMSWLRPLQIPIVLDLFAPRLLENQWETDDPAQETLAWLDALSRADYFIVTTQRARYLLLGQLPLAGVDCRSDRLLTIPLSILLPEASERQPPHRFTEHPLLVAGGVAWPWQDPRWALEQAVGVLKQHPNARLRLLRGAYPLHAPGQQVQPLPIDPTPPVEVEGMLPYADMLKLFETAWGALDLMAPNLEREVALSFRQLDALRTGLPLIIGAHAPLAPLIADFEAGWVVRHGDADALQQALAELLQGGRALERKSRNVQKLARKHFDSVEVVRPLLAILANASRRIGRETLAAQLSRQSTLARDQAIQFKVQAEQLSHLANDITKKDEDIRGLRHQVQSLTDVLGRVTLALEEQVFARRDAEGQVISLGHHQQLEKLDAIRELSTLRRELQKKTEANVELTTQREALESAIERLHSVEESSRLRADRATESLAVLEGKHQSEQALHQATQRQLETLSLALDKKQLELDAHREQREQLQQSLLQLQATLEARELALIAEQTTARKTLEENSLNFRTSLEQVTQESEARLELVRKQHAEELESLRYWHEKERTAITSANERLLEQAKQLNDAALNAENTVFSKNAEITELTQRLSDMQRHLTQLEQQHRVETQYLDEKFQQMLSANQRQQSEHAVETRMMGEEVSAFRLQVQMLEMDRQSLQQRVATQQQQLKTQQEALEHANRGLHQVIESAPLRPIHDGLLQLWRARPGVKP